MAKQHQVTVVCRRFPGQAKVSRSGNLAIVRISANTRARYLAGVLRHARETRYDVIQVDNRPHNAAFIKGAFPGIPVSLFLHSLTFVPKTARVAADIQKADLVIVNSHSLRDRIIQRFPAVSGKVRIVYLGVDTARFRPARRKTGNRPFTVLFAGRVIPRKGVPILIEAVGLVRRKIKRARLVVVGGGKPKYVGKLKRQARRLKVPATFVGKVAHRSMPRYYRAVDCFVCPSQRHEAFGLVNVEAMACGLPVIASDIGGIREIVRHGRTGYLVRNIRNPAEFSKYILKLATDSKTAAAMAKAGRQEVLRRFHWRMTSQKLLSLYANFLHGNRLK